jgi:hypothetical protein
MARHGKHPTSTKRKLQEGGKQPTWQREGALQQLRRRPNKAIAAKACNSAVKVGVPLHIGSWFAFEGDNDTTERPARRPHTPATQKGRRTGPNWPPGDRQGR